MVWFGYIYTNLRECTRIYANLREFTRICANLREFARVYMNLREFTRICASLHLYYLEACCYNNSCLYSHKFSRP